MTTQRASENPKFIEFYKAGHTTKKIADMMSVGVGTVRKWVGQAIQEGRLQTRIRNWTAEETQTLREMYEGGSSLEDIGAKLDRKVCGVEGRVAVLKIRRKVGKSAANQTRWTPDMEALVIKLAKAKLSDQQIGLRMGLSDKAIANKRRKLGAASGVPRYSEWSEEKTQKLRNLWPFHGTTEIARLMGLTLLQVHTKSLRMNLPRKGYPETRKTADRTYDTIAEANRKRAGIKTGPRPKVVEMVVAPEVIPEHAKPWLQRSFGQCAYPYGERGNVHSCCKPVFGKRSYCEGHAGLCFNFDKKAA